MLGEPTIYPPFTNFLLFTCAKNYENWLIADEVITMKTVCSFLAHLKGPEIWSRKNVVGMIIIYWNLRYLHHIKSPFNPNNSGVAPLWHWHVERYFRSQVKFCLQCRRGLWHYFRPQITCRRILQRGSPILSWWQEYHNLYNWHDLFPVRLSGVFHRAEEVSDENLSHIFFSSSVCCVFVRRKHCIVVVVNA